MLQLKMKRPFTNPFLLPVAPFVTAPEPLKVCYRPCSDVSMHALIEMEDILSINCGLLLDLQHELNSY